MYKKYLLALFISTVIIGCNRDKYSQYGFIKIDELSKLRKGQTYFKAHNIVIHNSENYLKAMSTKCITDNSVLNRIAVDSRILYRSNSSESVYDELGNTLSDSKKDKLHYYRLIVITKLEKKYLYVVVGDRVNEFLDTKNRLI